MTTTWPAHLRRATEAVLEQGRREAIADFFAPGYVAHVSGQTMKGHDAVAGVMEALRRAVPELRVDVEILVEGDGRIAWLRTCRGTQAGAFKGFPASGKELVWRDMVVSRFERGLIAEEWVVTDLAERLLLARKG
ncbi:ester cyclase [Roseateles sp. LYH14W]|uniref:Ester cyclase n=1 Tax=Pelomonas parva TaxID=3299032 RepID=A0ABW7F6K6_9BURK